MHCAYLLRTIFASLARANECFHVHNERNFPQAELNSEINARFLLNEQTNIFLFHNNSVHIIVLNLKKIKNLSEGKKSTQNRYSAETTTIRLKERFTSTLFQIVRFFIYFYIKWYCSICSTLSTCQVFFPEYYFN